MDKNIIKIIVLLVVLVVLVAGILFVTVKDVNLGIINSVSISGIASKKSDIEESKVKLEKAQYQYELNTQTLESAKKEFQTQKEKYDLIGEDTLAIIKEATKEEQYFIEYLWITLGNYASAHDLALSIVEPGGTVNAKTDTTTTTDNVTSVSTGTGITGNDKGVNSVNNAATTGSPTSGVQQGSSQTGQTTTTTTVETISPSANDLTVQVKGSYIDVADFVFEVENDKSLRFKLDNIKMKSAGGTEVLTSFNVKDFTVLKELK